jgi:hypothetical protein
VASQLIQTITLLYGMQSDDIDTLADQLLAQRAVEWQRAIEQELRRYGCDKPAQSPVGADALELFRLSEQDARGIATTYNRQLEAQVQRLYDANPRGNRNYYFSQLEQWATKRNAYKSQQIALNTAATTRQYAQQRFREENNIQGKFLFSGPAPVCMECTQLKAMGLVTLEVVNRYPSPRHPNCPHEWTPARVRGGIDCEAAWAGA